MWRTYTGPQEAGKQECSDPGSWGPACAVLIDWLLHDPSWLTALRDLTGVADLEGATLGGGLHQTGPGGHLNHHVDFTEHDGRYRRVNVLLYLNDGWSLNDGGTLELLTPTSLVSEIVPRANRLVVFDCGDNFFHGHPEPVAPGRLRKSIATYYFSATPPPGYSKPHSTEWL